MKKLLIIEDDPTTQTELKTLLTAHGYQAEAVTDFHRVTDIVGQFMPHLILLDINLPVEDGFAVCAKIRAFSDVPIIFVTSRSSDIDELSSIMLGGDAFITKPYNTAILLAKIAALLKKQFPGEQEHILRCRDVLLHLDSSRIEYQNNTAELTKNEFKIMCYLFRNAGKICSRPDIIDYLWDNQLYVDDNTLSVNITRIREKLAGLELTDFIRTKHRQGYII